MRVLRLLFICLLAACFVSCGYDDGPAYRVDLDERVEVPPPRPLDAVTYAYLPQYSHAVSYERHHRIISYLSEKTGMPFRQVFPDTFDEHVKMVERGEIDISYSNPFIYARLADSFGARAFARIVEPSGKPFFRGQIIVRDDNPLISSLEDCRGKRWIAVDPGSAGGYLFPLGLFAEHGIHPADFTEVAFASGPAGRQEQVVMSVYAGRYDVGTIREGTLDLLRDRIDLSRIRVLAETRPFPGWVYAARSGLSEKTVEKIRDALTDLNMNDPGSAEILRTAGMRGIISAYDYDYDSIRTLTERLGVED